MGKKINIVASAAVCIAHTVAMAQIGEISNPGRVIDQDGKPLKNAMITYTNPAKRLNYAFSDDNGRFGTGKTGIADHDFTVNNNLINDIKIVNSTITFYLSSPQKVTLTISNIAGRQIATVFNNQLGKGLNSIDLSRFTKSRLADNTYLIKIQTEGASILTKMVSLDNKVISSLSTKPQSQNQKLAAVAKTTTIIDSVRVGKTGYKAVYIPISSLTDSVKTIKLVKIDIEKRIDTVMARMTLADKIAFMTQDYPDDTEPYKSGTGIWPAGQVHTADDLNKWNDARMKTGPKIPSFSGYDCVHGYIGGMAGETKVEGTMFPHNNAMGCIQDTTLIQMAGRVTAIESASRGVLWVFSPCVAVVRDEHWGRIYEGLGETPEISAKVGRHLILGLQGRDLSLNTTVVATAKHFAGDGGTLGGANAGDCSTGEDDALRAIHLPPFASAIEAEVGCIMPSFSQWRGKFMHCYKPLLTDWLKDEMNFDGFVVGDWGAHTYQRDYSLSSGPGGIEGRPWGVAQCVTSGLDNPMCPDISPETKGDIAAGQSCGAIPESRINDACRRILRIIFRKGLFEDCHAPSGYDNYFYGEEHRAIARKCVAASMVVLKNEKNTLPLKKTSQKIAVIGTWGDDVRLQCGGWTFGWKGNDPKVVPDGTTMFKALQEQGGGNNVVFSADGNGIPSDASVVIVCVGVDPDAEYTKTNAQIEMNDSKFGKINDLMSKASSSGKPIVLVLYSDGPAVVTEHIKKADAVVCAWLGSSEGGGFGDILYGEVKPSGKLNHSWPESIGQIPINNSNMGDFAGSGGVPLYPIGYGLTY